MRWLLFLVSLLCVSIPAIAKDLTIHGFVTEIKSPSSFEIDDYKVTRDNTVGMDITGASVTPATFLPEDIRVGTELEVKGEYDEQSGELKAKSIKVFLEDTVRVKRMALLERMPELTRNGSGWEGEIRADGERIRVRPATSVTVKANHSEAKKLAGANHEPAPLTSLDELNLDTFVRYEGTRGAAGEIDATQVEFQHEELEPGEAKFRKQSEPVVKSPDYSSFAPGEFKMRDCVYGFCEHEIVPSQEAQDYITKLGESLIPAHQKELAADDPLKISFRFYLIKDKSFNAAAYPSGAVVVHSAVFDILQNEAQLAFVLSHEISHAVEKHAWQAQHYHRKELAALRAGGAWIPYGGGLLTSMTASGIQNAYARSLEDQADRVALEWMLAAGYDIREAPASWKAVSEAKGDGPVNPIWSNHDNKTMRRSYLMAELRNTYSDVDFSKLKKDSEEFHHVAELVQKFEAKGKQAKSQ